MSNEKTAQPECIHIEEANAYRNNSKSALDRAVQAEYRILELNDLIFDLFNHLVLNDGEGNLSPGGLSVLEDVWRRMGFPEKLTQSELFRLWEENNSILIEQDKGFLQ